MIAISAFCSPASFSMDVLRHKNGESIPVLSREFELSYCGVRDIIRRRVWKHVDE